MNQAEFDAFADEYYAQHSENIKLSGESPEFFAEYKIKTLARLLKPGNRRLTIVDFGAGIGNYIPYFRRYFPSARLICADISQRSLNIAKERFPGTEEYCLLNDHSIPLSDGVVDVVFSACVFHHIDPSEHMHWLSELRRITKSGGTLCIFEHNPYNPLTVHMVNTCPFDVNAKLLSAPTLTKTLRSSGWRATSTRYHLFFPAILRALRSIEAWLEWAPIGGQYSVFAEK